MSELKDIVPTLGLCKLIPAGEFEESVLVWTAHGVRSVEELSRLEFCKNLPIRKMTFPAPTLEEALDALADLGASFCDAGMSIGNNWYDYPISAEEALRLWLKVKGIGDVR
ncbi:MAG TPA: hypothetical protein K8W19_15625 [Victivallis vadensis]|nr:hypothetical protein [Victivallis vadensis]